MKIKRSLLIIFASVLLLFFVIMLIRLVVLFKMVDGALEEASVLLNMIGLTSILYWVCALAVVDFLFCLGEKKYSLSMFGIAIALFTLTVLTVFSSVFLGQIQAAVLNGLISYPVPAVSLTLDTAPPALVAYLVGTGLLLLGFISLAIAYIVVKRKYLKSI